MSNHDLQREHIERAIARARDGVSDRIDELDFKLRNDYDPNRLASEHAPKIIAGGLVLGVLVGFGFPKTLRRLIAIGVPIAIIIAKIRAMQRVEAGAAPQQVGAAPDYVNDYLTRT